MHASLNAILKITLRQAAVSIFEEISCESHKIFSFSRFELFCASPAPIARTRFVDSQQQAAVWCRVKRKIDERDFVQSSSMC